MCSMFIFNFLINFLPIKLFNDIDVNIVFKVLYFIIGSWRLFKVNKRKYFIIKSRFTLELIKINYELEYQQNLFLLLFVFLY
jgi:hypothetical protein